MTQEELFEKEVDCLNFMLGQIKDATKDKSFGHLQQLTDRYVDLRNAMIKKQDEQN